jgi:hypothetical protein
MCFSFRNIVIILMIFGLGAFTSFLMSNLEHCADMLYEELALYISVFS